MPKNAPHLPGQSSSGLVEQPPSRAEVAKYIGEMAAELSQLARDSELPLLAYLLDMVKLEAEKSSPQNISAGR